SLIPASALRFRSHRNDAGYGANKGRLEPARSQVEREAMAERGLRSVLTGVLSVPPKSPAASGRSRWRAPQPPASWIQIVFVSVYWSWAWSDLSWPPKPDSLEPPNGGVMEIGRAS